MGRKCSLLLLIAVCLGLPAPAAAASDPFSDRQWALARIQAEQAWSAGRGDGSVVAVVDTGVDFGHPDLAGKQAGSFDCFEKNPCVEGAGDPNGHGTAVAGIIGAQNNTVGIAPVAPAAKILSVRVLNADGAGSVEDVSRGIKLAADNGAKIINLSLAGSPGEPIVLLDLLEICLGPCTSTGEREQFQQAVTYAANKGALIVAAAGNENGLDSFYSGMDNVFVVGATGPDDRAAPYSSSGAEIFAPGGAFGGPCGDRVDACILTTYRGGYAAFQGTSFAAPHISGIAALLGPALSPGQIVSRIQETAETVPAGRRANARLALGAASGVVDDSDSALVPEPGSAPVGARTARRFLHAGRPGAAGAEPPAHSGISVIELKPRGSAGGAGMAANDGRDDQGTRVDLSSSNKIPAAPAAAAAAMLVIAAGGNAAYFRFRRRNAP